MFSTKFMCVRSICLEHKKKITNYFSWLLFWYETQIFRAVCLANETNVYTITIRWSKWKLIFFFIWKEAKRSRHLMKMFDSKPIKWFSVCSNHLFRYDEINCSKYSIVSIGIIEKSICILIDIRFFLLFFSFSFYLWCANYISSNVFTTQDEINRMTLIN